MQQLRGQGNNMLNLKKNKFFSFIKKICVALKLSSMLCLRVVPPLPPLLATLEAKQQKKLDGVYMSSSVPDSEKVWNYQVNDESLEWELENGNIESIREHLPGR